MIKIGTYRLTSLDKGIISEALTTHIHALQNAGGDTRLAAMLQLMIEREIRAELDAQIAAQEAKMRRAVNAPSA